jgi:hypothetical protein
MEFDAVKPDAPIGEEQVTGYWREKAECLEEWVCELLRKNQALRMDLEREQFPHGHRKEKTTGLSFLSLDRPPYSSTRLAVRTGSPELIFAREEEPCPRMECVEIRKWVIHNAFITKSLPETNN